MKHCDVILQKRKLRSEKLSSLSKNTQSVRGTQKENFDPWIYSLVAMS